MKVYRKINDIPVSDEKIVMAMGTFDGLHKGHETLLETVLNVSSETGHTPYVFTFSNSPKTVFQPYVKHMQLLDPGYKLDLLEKKGIQGVILIDFSKDFAKINAEVLCNLLQKKFVNLSIVVGYDFRMGKGTRMDAASLAEKGKISGFNVHIVPPYKINEEKVSSTRIRTLIRNGSIKEANALLGRPYAIEGIVEVGNQKGRQIGFPTVNIKNDAMVYPRGGVYLAGLRISENINENGYPVYQNRLHYGMTFVGKNTLSMIDTPAIETNIFELDSDLYGKWVRVYFFDRIRNTLTFKSFDDLKIQLMKDKEESLNMFKNLEDVNVS